MVTIDRLDISHYFQYARRVASVEQTYSTFRLEQAQAISNHTRIVDVNPKFEEIEVLFGFRRSTQPWACFCAPANYHSQRRSTFAFDRVCPTLGSFSEQMVLLGKVRGALEKEGDEQQQEQEQEEENPAFKTFKKVDKRRVLACMEEIEKLNQLITFIIARVGQFLQA